ncbi:MAG: hypothetical protein DRJ10_02475 [Bacteroidetes bacterium]|nr:MAG: hypothetical protein DRJ10_02475 [Bacteroidota bacterium]
MKVLVMKLLVVVVAITLTGKMNANTTTINAQNSENKSLDISEPNQVHAPLFTFELTQVKILAAEERKVHIEVDTNEPNSTASAQINVYSLDGNDVLGPYTVNQGDELIVTIDEREWAIETLSITSNSELTHWITE